MNTTDFPVRFPRKSKIALLSLMLTGSYVFGTMPNALAENTNYFQVSDSSKLITNNETIKNQLFYVIKKGETIESIAKSQQVSVSTIWSLNKGRFATLNAMLDAPPGTQIVLPLNKIKAEKEARSATDVSAGLLLHSDPVKSSSAENFDSKSTKQYATVGNTLQSITEGNAQYAVRNIIGNEAQSQLQSWLQRYGTAELNLQSGNNFDGSSLDFLLPFYDTEDMMAFSQIGGRYIDSRFTGNLGAGQRFFTPTNMLGYNVFIDRDFSGSNTRLGIGAEYWRDYFKSSANGYFRLTNWHQSYNKEDYDERPANGFDIRVNGYLPSWPALGAKVMYEQYYGDNVALFNADQLQSNPGALTVGLNYTPVPLVTMGVDYRHGTGNENDVLYSLQLRYQLDKPWSQQIEPQNVEALRTLSGSRYDLVQRNNNIVMEYKKQNVISLTLPQNISGTAGSLQNIQVVVKSKHALDHIAWDDSALKKNGGEIRHGSGKGLSDYQVLMPAYNPSGNNVYQVMARAYDSNGNSSNNAPLTVTVTPGSIVEKTEVTDFTHDKNSAAANNTEIITFTAKVTKGGSLQDNVPVSFSIVSGTATLSSTSSNTDSAGLATVTLKSSTPGQVIVAAKTSEMSSPLNATPVNFVNESLASITSIEVDKTSAVANGIDRITYTATVMKNGNPLSNETVTFATSFGNLSQTTVTTNTAGKASVTLTSANVGKAVVSAHTSEVATPVNAPEVEFIGNLSIDSITVDKTSAISNGTDKFTYTVTVTRNSQPAANETVNFTSTLGILSQSTLITDSSGKAVVTLTSSTAGKALVTATSDGVQRQANEVEFFSPLSIDNGNVEIIGTGVSGALPSTWLQYGQIRLKVTGGNGTYTWKSANSSAASVEASSGKITLNSKAGTTITVTSGDNQTATYTINAPTKLITADTSSRVTYAAANATCAATGRLANDQSELAGVFATWGAANTYDHYSNAASITAWVKQTSAEIAAGAASTYDLVRQNPLSNVKVNSASAFAVCVQ
ncbi:LysM peptidoglycan-binding domain-containing protein [Salmonella enterica subsp. salamae]|nr:LysM peptidoglycan-binding domain-containing protein [Salmonella enterica subsp. salamae]